MAKRDKQTLPLYVLYNDTTSDYPGEWVVRRQVFGKAGKITIDKELSARGATKDKCIDALFEAHPETRDMVFFKDDNPCIEGTFL